MDDKLLRIRERFALGMQRVVGWVTYPCWGVVLIGLMRFGANYKIHELREIRKRYKELVKQSDGPVLVCANHLTKIDSALINWSLASTWSYMRSFRCFPWNMPERARYAGNVILRMICYLGSCIPVERGGDRESVKKSLDKLTYLMKKGHTITIFPEGKRSLTGRIDPEDYSYGAGRLVRTVENCKVLCIYLRGYNQSKSSGIPKRGEHFYFDMEVIQPQSTHNGLRATRDISAQIIQKLAEMEETFFSSMQLSPA